MRSQMPQGRVGQKFGGPRGRQAVLSGQVLGTQVLSASRGRDHLAAAGLPSSCPRLWRGASSCGDIFHLLFSGPLLGNSGTFGPGLGWAGPSWR